ncbi:hypothetical protein FDP41_011184 [Naegleria fowleri]|uniref:Uncharacterized protein n=1 Tax=Naegleria fowleri TaxID=5763 RepID=A0A6A5C6K0_NAEFO|nr:uncharacterized protein FDP41_011184 [Naegleria fowleri]KAF0982721.1 hypothetical protein FDP41_011184 [Naegleria fowleri]
MIDFSISMPFMYLLFDILLELLNYSSSEQFTKEINMKKLRVDLQTKLFEALLLSLNKFHEFCGNSTRGNRFFSSYIKFIFNFESLHCELMKVFIQYLTSNREATEEKHPTLADTLERKDHVQDWKVFVGHLLKLEFDERYQPRENRERITSIIFTSLVDTFFNKGEELLLKLKQFNEINVILSTLLLWTMRNYNRDALIRWWRDKTLHCSNELNDLSIVFYMLKFMKNIVLAFRGVSKEHEQQSKKIDFVSKSYQVVVYILNALFIGKDGSMMNLLISLFHGLSDTAADGDYVDALLYKLIQLIRHITIHSLLRHDGNTCFLVVKSLVTDLVTHCKKLISVHEIENARDLSMKF